MYDFQISEGYICVTDINGNEVLHIEMDADIKTIAEEIEGFVGEINNHNF